MTYALTVVDLPTLTDVELDRIYGYLLGKHREALGPNKANIHAMIMAIVGEWSARLDRWLDQLPPIPVARQ